MTTALPFLAFSMGLVSSLHCIGMCGPIALALPVHKGTRSRQVAGTFLYNAGRTATYAMLGMFAGGAGMSVAGFGWLRYLSIAAGLFMLIYVCWPKSFERHLRVPGAWQLFIHSLKKQMSVFLQSRKMAGLFVLGLLNGLIPCGLVYLALASSLATGSILGGSVFMVLYGLGTFPAMMAVGMARQWFTSTTRNKIRRLAPVVIAVAGAILIFRGIIGASHTTQAAGRDITVCR